jgi:hypothetical protein
LLTNQASDELVFVTKPGTASQTAFLLPVVSPTGVSLSIDDSVFPKSRRGFLLVTDQSAGVVYKVQSDSPLRRGTLFSAALDAGILGVLDIDTGVLSPVVTIIAHPRGLAFVRGDEGDEEEDNDQE